MAFHHKDDSLLLRRVIPLGTTGLPLAVDMGPFSQRIMVSVSTTTIATTLIGLILSRPGLPLCRPAARSVIPFPLVNKIKKSPPKPLTFIIFLFSLWNLSLKLTLRPPPCSLCPAPSPPPPKAPYPSTFGSFHFTNTSS